MQGTMWHCPFSFNQNLLKELTVFDNNKTCMKLMLAEIQWYWAVQLQVQGWVLGYLNLRLRNLLTLDLDPDHEIVSCSN
jgi:hypothetical protein